MLDDEGHLVGGVYAAELLLAERGASVASLIESRVPTISPETELAEVARLMADYNLLAIPVVDDEQKPIGVIAFDDVLELICRRLALARRALARDERSRARSPGYARYLREAAVNRSVEEMTET